MIVSSFALYLYNLEQNEEYKEQLLTQMDGSSYSLISKKFTYTIVTWNHNAELHELIFTDTEIYALFPNHKDMYHTLVKVSYSMESFNKVNHLNNQKIFMIFGILMLVIAFISVIFAKFSLLPLRNALNIMENFLKDIIHDLNTPVSSILLNSQLLKRKYSDIEIDRVYISGKTITGLYKNLEVLYRELPIKEEAVYLKLFFEERIANFKALYPNLNFSLNGSEIESIQINKEILTRIIDNILSNACKYNKPQGNVIINYSKHSISIEDTGVGINNVSKVFQRFYRESDRGLGIGLHIVETLSKKIKMKIRIESVPKKGTIVHLTH